ncbi:23S rRNA (uracil(1939)-C(5))-methyltransferase RlmD [Candidatus Nitrospira allomarina]|uniref:23S rRNA (Uracil(1939)-C(5))-methyltransferase RlmD n=1 Tax=Candidatus Nitrospira allomarina TaxID=3020900 RepID=A0AA96G8H6_9BACT|nr:23S rRNA (uracil(1939)-C(5))-methyltransferase RlmD [Candidatus Nitrospira allomarina]WNM57354.1 23S rRNA (uracil(1939)-C(5))-methyltransferase RlmD [Candidatus Nitrospira allomarina]
MLNSGPNIKSRRTPSPSSTETLSPGSSHPLHIEKLVAGGFSLGRVDGQVVLCGGGIPGEALQVEILSRRKGVSQGKILQVHDPGDSRVVPLCPVVGRCGGCQLQHIQYEAQLSQKRLILEDTLRRIGKISNVLISPVIPSPRPYGYRQVLRMGIGEGPDGFFLGFFESGTQQLLPVDTCFLVDDRLRSVIDAVRSSLRSLVMEGMNLESVEIRWSQLEEGGLLVFRGRAVTKEHVERLMHACSKIANIKGLIYERADAPEHDSRRRVRHEPIVRGADHVWEAFGGLRLKMGFRSFMQANWDVFQLLGKRVEEWLGNLKGQRILELYAGTGPLGLSLASQGAQVTCVEGNPFAIHDARESLRMNAITGCRVRISSVESYLMTVKSGAYDVILLDPPRAGLNPKIIDRLGILQVPKLFYLSCDAPSLARDMKSLCEKGYTVQRMQPFDMFPQTAHLETLVELTFSAIEPNDGD